MEDTTDDQLYYFNCPDCSVLHRTLTFETACPLCNWHDCTGWPHCSVCTGQPLPDHVHACSDVCMPHGANHLSLRRHMQEIRIALGGVSTSEPLPSARALAWAESVFGPIVPIVLAFLFFGCVIDPRDVEAMCVDYHDACAHSAVTSADKISCDADYRMCSPYPAHEFLCKRWAGVSDHLVCVVVP